MAGLACNRCRENKRRCVYAEGSKTCKLCVKAGARCITEVARKQRAKPRRTDNDSAVMKRLELIEDLLTNNSRPGDETGTTRPAESSTAQPPRLDPALVNVDESSTRFDPTNLNHVEVGTGQQNANTRPQSTDLRSTQDQSNVSFGINSNDGLWEPEPSHCDLPPVRKAWNLLQDYLLDFNNAVPLFDKESLIDLYKSVYAGDGSANLAEKAAVRITLVIAHRLRATSPLGTSSDNELAQTYFARASATLPEILTHAPTLTSIQCIVGIAAVMHATANFEAALSLLSTAQRLIIDTFYFGRGNQACTTDCEQLKRVYWIAFSIEMDLNIRTGRWYSAACLDSDIPLPDPPPANQPGQASDEEELFHLFQSRVELSQIQSRLFRTIFRFQASKERTSQVKADRAQVVNDLQEWREAHLQLTTDSNVFSRSGHRSNYVHNVTLEASYFMTVFALRSLLNFVGPFRGSVLSNLEKYDRMNFNDCVNDAKSLLRLFGRLPEGNYAHMWTLTEAVVTALYVVLNVVIQQSSPESQDADLALAAGAILGVSNLITLDTRTELTRAAKIVEPLYDVAKGSRGQKSAAEPQNMRRINLTKPKVPADECYDAGLECLLHRISTYQPLWFRHSTART